MHRSLRWDPHHKNKERESTNTRGRASIRSQLGLLAQGLVDGRLHDRNLVGVAVQEAVALGLLRMHELAVDGDLEVSGGAGVAVGHHLDLVAAITVELLF